MFASILILAVAGIFLYVIFSKPSAPSQQSKEVENSFEDEHHFNPGRADIDPAYARSWGISQDDD